MDICELAITNYATLQRHPWEEARIAVIADMLRKETALLQKKEIQVLDVGCGDAYVAYRLSLLFPSFRFLCVDTAFSPELRRKLNEQIASEKIMLFENLEEAEAFYSGSADYVFLFDVIEHIEDDIGFLKYLRTSPLLSAETKVFITVPAFQSLFSKHDVFLKHYRRHTITTLKNTVEKAGFRGISTGYFFFALLLPRLLQKLFENKKKSLAKGIGDYRGSALKTAMIKNILLMDYRFFNIFTKMGLKAPGLSCYILCKRKN